MESYKSELNKNEEQLLYSLRNLSKNIRKGENKGESDSQKTRGQRIADKVAAIMGSWSFIIAQSVILFAWIVLNLTAYVKHWDPYPFILLNLALSFQAAYAAPFIMMSQNRQQEIDRKEAQQDYKVNIKAELEIELLHHKIDQMREKEILGLIATIKELADVINKQAPN